VADLTSAGTGAGGLGTSGARWAVTAVWGLGMLSDVLSGSVAPPFGSELLALPFGLVGAVLLTTRGDDALSGGRARVVALCVHRDRWGWLLDSLRYACR
jgi:hypothetical protein